MMSYNLTYFVLAGFTLNPSLRISVVAGLILIYSISLMGNCLIIMITSIDQHLQAPMYFFLRNLATMDIIVISTTVPKLLSVLVSSDKSISLNGCLLQFYFYGSSGITELYILGVLSIDRYMAICYPLRYSTIITIQVCGRLSIGLVLLGFLEVMLVTLLVSRLHWCNGNVIDHFFCDVSPLLQLSCSDAHVIKILIFYSSSFAILSSFIVTVFSYYFIISSILHISSSTGRRKTFSTCSSHFIAVIISYGSCIFIYVVSARKTPSGSGKTLSIFNSILTPLLHPFIYSLRNQVVITSLRRMTRMN